MAADEKSPSYKRGKKAGRRAANRDTEIQWSIIDFVYGFTLGPIAVGHSLVSSYVLDNPDLPNKREDQIYNNNRDYKEGFKDGYFNVKNRNSLLARTTGWIGWIGTWAVLDQMQE
uniref:Uncharacterized protein n=1 Tax=uncultured organism TaxID=155900 RepID=M1QBY0_9ZZZZ|nr:hypothetical protein FLSS-27_0027 [uncultured organism]